ALLNESFLSVKVDREERPDVDQIYMAAVQAMTGHGGWPMSVFLTPEGKPFYGGTYFPPADRHGMPGFPRVLMSVAQAWENRQDEIRAAADGMTDQLQSLGQLRTSPGNLDESLLDNAFRKLSRGFDPQHGGFGDAPKFPHPMDLRVLMRHHHRTADPHALHMVRLTLDRMAQGGIYDHLGGGFARYSTDERWLVPHFEKMLYDNALLASTYVEAYQLTREPRYHDVVRETLDYVLDRLTAPDGGFYSTEDADSEGVEGKYYVWSLAEIRSLLGDEKAETFAKVYDITEHGNWEHANILNLPRPIAEVATSLQRDEDDLRSELKESRKRLLEAREQRVPPGKDTKILTSWNGLMIAALAEAGRAFGVKLKGSHFPPDPNQRVTMPDLAKHDHTIHARYLDAAEKAAGFLLDHHRLEDGRLLHASKDGRARFPGYLEDYAYLIDGLTRLFEATGNALWITSALELTDLMLEDFLDDQ
ncbi:MAG TPA: thioredoxin domain-containing protein, partial [Isosphaeraceae bacterium]|nr:thioredoxin domain-containing protein [Isosphaeraceae bacterium]